MDTRHVRVMKATLELSTTSHSRHLPESLQLAFIVGERRMPLHFARVHKADSVNIAVTGKVKRLQQEAPGRAWYVEVACSVAESACVRLYSGISMALEVGAL